MTKDEIIERIEALQENVDRLNNDSYLDKQQMQINNRLLYLSEKLVHEANLENKLIAELDRIKEHNKYLNPNYSNNKIQHLMREIDELHYIVDKLRQVCRV